MATVPAVGLAEPGYFTQIVAAFLPCRMHHVATVVIDSSACAYGDREFKYARATSMLFQMHSAHRAKAMLVNATYFERFVSKDISQSLPRHKWGISVCTEFNPLYLTCHREFVPSSVADVRLDRLERHFSMVGFQSAGSGKTYDPLLLSLWLEQERCLDPCPRLQPWDLASRIRDAVAPLKPFASDEHFQSLRAADFLNFDKFNYTRYAEAFRHLAPMERIAKLVASHDIRDIVS